MRKSSVQKESKKAKETRKVNEYGVIALDECHERSVR
jgi:HrpA-like RNA helicase